MKLFLVLTALVAMLNFITCQRTSTQTVAAYCTRMMATNRLKFDFRLDVKSDPVGTVGAIDMAGNDVTCSIAYNATDKYYSFVSEVSLTDTLDRTNNCGLRITNNGELLATWVVRYSELPSEKKITMGLNRNYTATCNITETTSDRRDATISVSSPTLNQNVTISQPSIALSVLYWNGANYVPATTSTAISTGTNLTLQLQVNYGTFEENKIYAVAGLMTEASGTSDFASTVSLLDGNGCPANNQYDPDHGFRSLTSNTINTIWVSNSGPFPAFQFTNQPFLYFRVTYEPCRAQTFNTNQNCNYTCAAYSSGGRRRRSAGEDGEPVVLVASIRVYDPTKMDEASSQTAPMVYVGVGVAVGVLFVLLALVICIVFMRRQRYHDDEKKSTRVPSEGFTNSLHY